MEGSKKIFTLDGKAFTLEEIKLKYIVMGFLSELNKITTGIITSDISEYDHPRFQRITFESQLSSVFVDGGLWNPHDIFWRMVDEIARDYFLDYHDSTVWEYNNTKTVFSIDKEFVCSMKEK